MSVRIYTSIMGQMVIGKYNKETNSLEDPMALAFRPSNQSGQMGIGIVPLNIIASSAKGSTDDLKLNDFMLMCHNIHPDQFGEIEKMYNHKLTGIETVSQHEASKLKLV